VKVRIDEAACEGHGRCLAIAPALFELDELGTSSLIGDGSVSPADEELVRLAAANCPEFAIGISGE
jgi:ferredoxin